MVFHLLSFFAYLHHEEYDEYDHSPDEAEQPEEEPLAGTLAVDPPVPGGAAPLLGPVRSDVGSRRRRVQLLELLLRVGVGGVGAVDVVVADVLPHDVGDGGGDEAEVQLDLDAVLHDEGEEVGHGGGPKLAKSVVVEALVEGDHVAEVLAGDGYGAVASRHRCRRFLKKIVHHVHSLYC